MERDHGAFDRREAEAGLEQSFDVGTAEDEHAGSVSALGSYTIADA